MQDLPVRFVSVLVWKLDGIFDKVGVEKMILFVRKSRSWELLFKLKGCPFKTDVEKYLLMGLWNPFSQRVMNAESEYV